MAEPDGVMPGPLWPVEWATGWVSWKDLDLLGNPIDQTIPGAYREITITIPHAEIPTEHATVWAVPIVIPIVNGAPSGPLTAVNSNGDVCLELPVSVDPDVAPFPVPYQVSLSWMKGEEPRTFEVLPEHTLDQPKWLTGDVSTLTDTPGVTQLTAWMVDDPDADTDVAPLEAKVGDLVWYTAAGIVRRLIAL